MPRRRRFKIPVISRLAWAWTGAFLMVVSAGALILKASYSGEGANRIALPVGQIERLARAPREERLAAPAAPIETGAVETTMESADEAGAGLTLIYPGEEETALLDDEEESGEIVITIAGQRAQPALSPQAASLAAPARAIPDPDPALLASTPLGEIPRIAPDGRAPLRYYARRFEGDGGAPRVAIIVGGLGLNSAVTERAIDELPADISLSFAPYAKDLEFWTEKARRAGHEVLIELPMEGYGGNAQALGAAALLSSRTPEENLQRLNWLMARFGGYVAATNYQGAKFSADGDAIAPVLRALKEAGVGYVDDTGAARRAGAQIGLPMASVTRIIPASADPQSVPAIRRELAALEQAAARDGAAIGKTYAYATTIDEIVAWSRTLEGKGLAAAPASGLLQAGAAAR